MTTYLLITSDKPTELTAFVGPEKPKPIDYSDWSEDDHRIAQMEEQTDGPDNRWRSYESAIHKAKASRLPVVNFEKLIGHTSSSGSVYIYDRLEELKPGEVVPLPGWELEKVYQKQYEDRWIITSKYNYGLGKTTDYPESFRQAYRLKRSEPVKDFNSFCEKGTNHCKMNYCDENGCLERKRFLTEPNESPIEAKTQGRSMEDLETPFSREIHRDLIVFLPLMTKGEMKPEFNLGYVSIVDGKRVDIKLTISVS